VPIDFLVFSETMPLLNMPQRKKWRTTSFNLRALSGLTFLLKTARSIIVRIISICKAAGAGYSGMIVVSRSATIVWLLCL
jgi:hypothetical protein